MPEFKETKKWRVVAYLRVDIPVEEDELYGSLKEAQSVHNHCQTLQPENLYFIEEVNDVERC